MTFTSSLIIDNQTTPHHVDEHMTHMFSTQTPIDTLYIDTTQCSVINAKRVMSLAPVMHKHRLQSRRLLQKTHVTVSRRWVARLLRCLLPLFRPEQPVSVSVSQFPQK